MSWIRTLTMEELARKSRAVIKHGYKQIALFAVGDGRIFATDNRCPHEGYPLAEGSLNPENCVLTCNWHNWKFEISTGENVSGEDQLNVYRTKQMDGEVWVEIPEVSREEIEARVLPQIEKAFRDQSYDRMAREL